MRGLIKWCPACAGRGLVERLGAVVYGVSYDYFRETIIQVCCPRCNGSGLAPESEEEQTHDA